MLTFDSGRSLIPATPSQTTMTLRMDRETVIDLDDPERTVPENMYETQGYTQAYR